MSRLLGYAEVQKQSKRAFDRWGPLWHENATENKKYITSIAPLMNIGANKKVIVCGFGPSFANNIKLIKKHNLHHTHDIIVIDKALKTTLKAGIIPNYLIVADAQVSFEKYGQVPKEICERVKLIPAITANYKWAKHWHNNGGKVYFTLNKDGIRTHKIFREYFKDTGQEPIIIPAASNVLNSAYVTAALYMQYNELLICGADYSYKLGANYYGDSSKPKDTNLKIDKKYFCNHFSTVDINNDIVQVSVNMQFSAKWLVDLINTLLKARPNARTVNITGAGILTIPFQARLTD